MSALSHSGITFCLRASLQLTPDRSMSFQEILGPLHMLQLPFKAEVNEVAGYLREDKCACDYCFDEGLAVFRSLGTATL